MIGYFDTSALIPLLVDEPGSSTAGAIWDRSDRVVSVRIVYAEARAALAQARRLGRVTSAELSLLVDGLNQLYDQMARIEIDEQLVRRAGELAQQHDLRGYDAVHLAGLESVAGDDTVLVAGDARLTVAAARLGVAVART